MSDGYIYLQNIPIEKKKLYTCNIHYINIQHTNKELNGKKIVHNEVIFLHLNTYKS